MLFRSLLGRDLNLISHGDEFALTRGVSVNFVRNMLFLVTSVIVSVTVSVCGVIGFVGIIVPHIARLLFGFEHRVLAPASFLLGGVLLVACDSIARILDAPAEIPVGVVTAILGGPFFIALLLSQSRKLYFGDE